MAQRRCVELGDPVAIEVCRHALIGIAEEMGSAMKRAAFSPMIKEREDRSCALFTPDLDLIAQAEHLPIHLALLPATVPLAFSYLDIERLDPGDVIVYNDPYIGGSHLPDFTMVAPSYHEGGLIGYCAIVAHMTDVGGSVPGGLGRATHVVEEGLRVPPVHLYRHGERVQEVFRVIRSNVRVPELMMGDVLAQIGALSKGAESFTRVSARFGREPLQRYMEDILTYTEARTRRELEKLPSGVYEFCDHVDDDGNSAEPIRICVRIELGKEDILFDFDGTAEQRPGPVNASLSVVSSAASFVVRSLIDPSIPTTSGCFRPVKIEARLGTVVNPEFPAPVGGGSLETAQRIVDCMYGALAKAIPGDVPAAGMGSHNTIGLGGVDPSRKRPFVFVDNIGGGGGGRCGADGLSGSRINLMNTPNNPVEIMEQELPLRIEHYGLRPDSCGAGEYRGGFGIEKHYRFLEEVHVSILSDRSRFVPWGLLGGEEARGSSHDYNENGAEEHLTSKCAFVARAGSLLVARTAGGGGYGPPQRREQVAIERDLVDELISFDHATSSYGLVDSSAAGQAPLGEGTNVDAEVGEAGRVQEPGNRQDVRDLGGADGGDSRPLPDEMGGGRGNGEPPAP